MSVPNYTTTYNYPLTYRGDTVDELSLFLRNSQTQDIIIPTAICAQLRAKNNKDVVVYDMVHEINPVTGEVKILAFSTEGFPTTTLIYDIQYTIPNEGIKTLVTGTLTLIEDVSRC
jgi:hypothetical protein